MANFLVKIEMMQESNLSKFKAEVQSSQVFLNHVDVMLCVEFEVYDFGACGCHRAWYW